MTQDEYNAEPVYYCRRCLSLVILNVGHVDIHTGEYITDLENSEYCDKCGSTDIAQCSIEEWEKMYLERYGHLFLNNTY